MKNLELSDLNNSIVNYYYVEIVENLDEDVKNYGMEKFEKAYAGYGGIVKNGIYFDIQDDGGWEKVLYFDEVSAYLEKGYSEEDDYRWCFKIDESNTSVDEFAKNIAESYKECVYDEGYGGCIHDGIIYVDIWKDGKKIYAGEF